MFSRISICLIIVFFASLIVGMSDGKITNTYPHTDTVRYMISIFKEVTIEKDIIFGEVQNSNGRSQKLLLDIYMPTEDNETNRPAIL